TSCARRTRSRPGEAMADEPLREALRDASRALVRRIEELSFVRSVGDVLAGAVEPAAVARALVGALRDELGADAAALWTVDAAGAVFRLAGASPDEEAAGATTPLDEPPLADVAGGGTAVRLAAGTPRPAALAGLDGVLHPI